jgi:hypothetical protein
MCRWDLGFSFIVLLKGFINFFVPPPIFGFSMSFNFLSFELQLCIWEMFRARFFRLSIGSPSSLAKIFPISKGGIGLVFTKFIAQTTYLGS